MEASPPEAGEKIAKVIAHAGLCSRRDAEKWVAEGRVAVDGQTMTNAAERVKPGQIVTVDGKPLETPQAARLWLFHKPKGALTTNRDPQGRQTIFDVLPKTLPRVVTIGRLDMSSEGLLLLTTDGGLARHLELPATGWVRRYRARVFGVPDEKVIASLKRGVTVDGVKYDAIEVTVERATASNCWLNVALKEGKNREIRKVMEHFGHPVSRLIRIAYGPFQLGNLAEGQVREVPQKVIRDQLGLGGPNQGLPKLALPGRRTIRR